MTEMFLFVLCFTVMSQTPERCFATVAVIARPFTHSLLIICCRDRNQPTNTRFLSEVIWKHQQRATRLLHVICCSFHHLLLLFSPLCPSLPPSCIFCSLASPPSLCLCSCRLLMVLNGHITERNCFLNNSTGTR